MLGLQNNKQQREKWPKELLVANNCLDVCENLENGRRPLVGNSIIPSTECPVPTDLDSRSKGKQSFFIWAIVYSMCVVYRCASLVCVYVCTCIWRPKINTVFLNTICLFLKIGFLTESRVHQFRKTSWPACPRVV